MLTNERDTEILRQLLQEGVTLSNSLTVRAVSLNEFADARLS